MIIVQKPKHATLTIFPTCNVDRYANETGSYVAVVVYTSPPTRTGNRGRAESAETAEFQNKTRQSPIAH